MEAKRCISYLCEPGLLLPASLPEDGEEGAGAAVEEALNMEAKRSISYLCKPGLLLPASLPEGGEEGAGSAVWLALKAQAEEGDQPQGVPAMCAVSLYNLRHLRINCCGIPHS
jgi:hypothetical protein